MERPKMIAWHSVYVLSPNLKIIVYYNFELHIQIPDRLNLTKHVHTNK